MRTISVTLQLLGLVVLLSLGYWVWYANWAPNPNDRIGAVVSRWMPDPVKEWGCAKLSQRFGAEAPSECGAAAPSAPSAPGAAPQSAPAPQRPDGGGRL